MKAYEIEKDWGIDNLVEVEREKPKAGPGQVVVAIKACSLNYRDLLTVTGKGGAKLPLIPFSDGAGEIVEIGDGVTRVKKGDRVCPIFFPAGSTADRAPMAACRRWAAPRPARCRNSWCSTPRR